MIFGINGKKKTKYYTASTHIPVLLIFAYRRPTVVAVQHERKFMHLFLGLGVVNSFNKHIFYKIDRNSIVHSMPFQCKCNVPNKF